MPQGVEGPGLDERVDGALVAHDRGNLVEEVLEGGELALVLPGGHDRVDDVDADVAHRRQPEAHVLTDRGELGPRGVDVRGQDGDAHVAALPQVDGQLVLVVLLAGEQGGHVLGRIVRLEVGRPVGHDAVGGRVGLVEGVLGEGDDDVPQSLDALLGEAGLNHPGLELDEHLGQNVHLLLTHGLAQRVGLAHGESRQVGGDLHDLLLVDDETVCGPQDRVEGLLELGVDRDDLLQAVLAQRVVGVGLRPHGAGPVEGADGGDVLEVVRLHQAQQRAHSPAVELEDAQGLTA